MNSPRLPVRRKAGNEWDEGMVVDMGAFPDVGVKGKRRGPVLKGNVVSKVGKCL
jgi:hypothetical protein|tara:strand:+ start:170 stop:331 length:162 start_codon:yes stop_codon:yes gene_type:complete